MLLDGDGFFVRQIGLVRIPGSSSAITLPGLPTLPQVQPPDHRGSVFTLGMSLSVGLLR
jgi:hypothetical protein